MSNMLPPHSSSTKRPNSFSTSQRNDPAYIPNRPKMAPKTEDDPPSDGVGPDTEAPRPQPPMQLFPTGKPDDDTEALKGNPDEDTKGPKGEPEDIEAQ